MERWDHASLLASPKRPSKTAWSESELSEPEPASPLSDGWEVQRATFRKLETAGGGGGIARSGWLLKAAEGAAAGNGSPARQWRRRFVWLTADRLCYTPDPDAEGARYLPLDRIPVRALPRGYGPKLGVALVEDRQVARPAALPSSPKKAGCVFSVACGAHTHFFAAPSAADAAAWVEAITSAWVQCVKHTARGTHMPSPEEAAALREARVRIESEALRRSLAEAEQQRLRESTAQWQADADAALAQPVDTPVVCYEIQVATGTHPDAGTTAHVFVELCGTHGSSGEHRLMYRDGSSRAAFAAGATDAFRLHCRALGELRKVRVFHNNAGAAPAWFLREVRVRQQGSGDGWTVFPCARWLAVGQDDGQVGRQRGCAAGAGRVMRELQTSGAQLLGAEAAMPPKPLQEAATPAERVVPTVWYTVAVCTSGEEGAGLAPAGAAAKVSLVLHGGRGSSQRVALPSQAGDFERGQEDVFRVQLPGVGLLERLTVGLSGAGEQASWLLEQVEVTDEGTGETVFFPCNAWLGGAKGATERSLLGSRTDAREATRLRQQVEAANRQLAEAQAQLAAAQSVAAEVRQAGISSHGELDARLAAQQAELAQLRQALEEVQQRLAAAEARVVQLTADLAAAQEREAALQRDAEVGRQSAAADSARSAGLAVQLASLQGSLAEAQEAAAAAASKARKSEADAQRAQAALDDLREQHERLARDASTRAWDSEAEVARLRREVAATAAELREAKRAQVEAETEVEHLARELAADRLKAKEQETATADACQPLPPPAASAQLQSTYRVCVHTSAEPPSAGTCRPVCIDLLGSSGARTGPIRLDPSAASTGCFAPGACAVFQVEAAAVGEPRQLAVWLDVEGAADATSWHLDTVEVACPGAAPACFVGRLWLDTRNQHHVELAASAHNPRQEEGEVRVVVHTSALPGCGTGGNVFLDLKGDKGSRGVLTLRNKGGSFRPGQADEFAFSLPALGALSELKVGHDGRKDWHLDRVEVSDRGGTTCFFPCGKWVKGSGPGGAMARSLQLRGYTSDPGSLPVQYRAELAVRDAAGKLGPDSLRLALFGARGESGVQHLDASHAAPGSTLACVFQAPNVGQLERLRIGLAAADDASAGRGSADCALLLSRITVTNLASGEAVSFSCAEWLRATDPYDFELDAEEGQDEVACRYRLEVQTSDMWRAATTGSVFVTLVGAACTIGPYQLSNTEAEHFQRGQLDVFEIDGAPDCGRLLQIEVRHDGTGRTNGWHLAWVRARNLTTGAVAMFKCGRWVDRRQHDDPPTVAVVVALPPDQAAAAAGQLSVKDRHLLPGGNGSGIKAYTTAAAAAQAPVPQQGLRREAELEGSWGEVGVAETQGPPTGAAGYRVVFHTSRMCGSGTKARVHFELTGSRGSSGVLHPVGTSKSFGSGRMDVFDYPALPFLGELQSARVGTNGSGFFPAWHLQLVVVTHLPTGRVWQFSCFNWIDKRCHYSRWLTLDCVEEREVYRSTGAGTYADSATAKTATGWHEQPQGLNRPGSAASSPLAAGAAPRQLQYSGSPGTFYTAGPRSGSPGGGSPQRTMLQKSPLGVGRHGSGRLAQLAGGSPPSPAMLYSVGSGMSGSPRIGARS